MVLPVPAVPVTKVVDPRNTPPPSMWSRRAIPVETRSSGAAWSSAIDVIGSTMMPWAEIRNGYSLVPWADPGT